MNARNPSTASFIFGSRLTIQLGCVVYFAVLFWGANFLHGQAIWIGTTNSWNTGTNWSTGSQPSNTTSVTFGNATGGNYTVSLTTANGTTSGITFDNTAGANAYTINTNGHTLTIGSGGIDNQNTVAQTFSGTGTVTLGAAQTWKATSGDMTFSASTLNFNSKILTLDGANDISASSAVTNSVGITVLSTDSGINSFTGAITAAGNQTITNDGTGSLSFSAMSIANRTTTFTGAGDTSVTGVISDSGGGGNLTYSGTGSLTLSGNNTYKGATAIQSGTVVVASNNALGTTGGSTTVSSGATLAFQNVNYSTAEAVSVSGTGASGSNGAIDNTSGTSSFAGAITLTGNTTMGAASGSQLTLSGVISDGASSFSLTKAGAGTLTLSGANTYNGGTTLSAGTLNINNGGTATSSAIGTGTFTISGGTIDNTSGAAITLATNNAQSWNGDFTFTGTNNLNLGTGAVTMSASRDITVSAGTLTVGGVISGTNFSLTKDGAGTLALSGANTFGGSGSSVTVNAGALKVSADNNLGNANNKITLNGGTLEAAGSFTLNSSRTLTVNSGGGTIQVDSGITLTLASGGQIVDGGGILTKSGAGTLTLGGNMTYTDEIDLAGGTLNLNGNKLTGTTLHVTGNSTIDFSGSLNSILQLTDLQIDSGVTLTVANWTNAADYFYATNNPGSTVLSQITFSGFTGITPKWLTYTDGPDNDHQITPVPEPSTYGALLTAIGLGFFLWRWRKASGRTPNNAEDFVPVL